MSVMRGSGTYYSIIDESFVSFDTIALNAIVPMYLKKGQKVQRVTYDNFKQKIGYDLDFNSNYLGLASMLEKVEYLDVWKINDGATYGNLTITKDGSSFSFSGIEDPEQLEGQLLYVSDDFNSEAGALVNTLSSIPLPSSLKILSNGSIIGQDDGNGNIVPVGSGVTAEGTIDYTTKEFEITLSGLLEDEITAEVIDIAFEVQYEVNSDVFLICYMESSGDWAKLFLRYKPHNNSYTTGITTNIVLPERAKSGSISIFDMNNTKVATSDSNNVIWNVEATPVEIGLYNPTTKTITFQSGNLPDVSQVKVEYISLDNPTYDMSILRQTSPTTYTPYESVKEVSFNRDNELFIENVEFESVKFICPRSPSVIELGISDPVPILYGEHGETPNASTIDFTPVKNNSSLFVIMNGLTGASLTSKFLQYFGSKGQYVICDAPNFKEFEQVKAYKEMLYGIDHGALYWVSDIRKVNGKEYPIFPSVNVLLAYAKMFSQTGYLNYPPAGYQFGGIVVEKLLETDASSYKADLKINKINYQTIESQGAVIWEQRTLYPYESDLSYISSILIYKHLADRIKRFLDNYGFKFIGIDDLSQITTNLESITGDYISRGFLWSANVKVPSFAEVKKEGARFMDIVIGVKIAEDSEERNFKIHIQRSAD